MDYIKIQDRMIGDFYPTFIVAELSANHLQSFDLAVKTIHSMKESGADAVKLQTYTPDTITIDSNLDHFQIHHGTLWDGRSLYQLYKKAYTPWEWHRPLKDIAEGLGLICFFSPFDKTAVDFLEEINAPAYKIASFEITDIPLIEYIASKGKPIIISTGIATLSDIEGAINACKRRGNDKVALLKCTSSYPTKIENLNLRVIPNMKDTFKTVVGLSDHTRSISAPLTAIAIGARIIEKHFILQRALGGPDAAFSIEPDEFKDMVRLIREVEKSLGRVTYELTDETKKNREFCRSLFAVSDIKRGEELTNDNVKSIRPGFGLHPRHLNTVLGRKAKMDIARGTPLKWVHLE